MNDSNKSPKVGVGVIIIRDDLVLLGKRKNSHGDQTWSFAGGSLEFGESIFECARRETKEETGLDITNLRYGPYTNDIFVEEKKHYVTAFVLASSENGEPRVLEPEKCEKWRWFKWDQLPEPLFLPVENLRKVASHQTTQVSAKIKQL